MAQFAGKLRIIPFEEQRSPKPSPFNVLSKPRVHRSTTLPVPIGADQSVTLRLYGKAQLADRLRQSANLFILGTGFGFQLCQFLR
jgi:hypothetical protein